MPDPKPFPPDVAAQHATNIISRLPPHFVQTDDDRVRLTNDLANFLTHCMPIAAVTPASPPDQDSAPAP